ncbi:MAG: Gfo/Idh/MocA family oxidoreductase [Bacteroidota bacterium]
MRTEFNWGIIGLGKIAHKFAEDLARMPNTKLHAVASRSLAKAEAFQQQYGATHAYGSYEHITSCPDLDAVYIATPHSAHCANTILCLKHQIPVLCEKPLALNSTEAQKMIAAAHEHHTFLMEALWTRFLPTTQKILELIEADTIGAIHTVKADFGFKPIFDSSSRLFDPALGGGALLDIGIYPVFLAYLLLGTPKTIQASVFKGATGVDEEVGMLFQYAGGQMAHLHTSLRAKTKTEAFIYGEKGTIHLHGRWHEPTSFSLLLPEQRPELFHFEWPTNGYSYEAQEVMQAVRNEQKESKLWTLQQSLDLMQLLDDVKASWVME